VIAADQLTAAQRATIILLLAEHGPGASYVVDRGEDHDNYIFVEIFDNNGDQILETIVEADGSGPSQDR